MLKMSGERCMQKNGQITYTVQTDNKCAGKKTSAEHPEIIKLLHTKMY